MIPNNGVADNVSDWSLCQFIFKFLSDSLFWVEDILVEQNHWMMFLPIITKIINGKKFTLFQMIDMAIQNLEAVLDVSKKMTWSWSVVVDIMTSLS